MVGSLGIYPCRQAELARLTCAQTCLRVLPVTGGAQVDRAPDARCAENFDDIQGSIEDDLLDLDAFDLDVHIDDRHSGLDHNNEAVADAFYDFDDAPTVASDVRSSRARSLLFSSPVVEPRACCKPAPARACQYLLLAHSSKTTPSVVPRARLCLRDSVWCADAWRAGLTGSEQPDVGRAGAQSRGDDG